MADRKLLFAEDKIMKFWRCPKCGYKQQVMFLDEMEFKQFCHTCRVECELVEYELTEIIK